MKRKKKRRKLIGIIGLGHFGAELARSLATTCDVLVLDRDKEKVNAIADTVQRALSLDARDEAALRAVIDATFDEAVVCIGGSIESSILCTLHLTKIGVPVIRVKADNDDHAAILQKVGATEMIFPERETARRMAARITNPNLLDFIPLGEEYQVFEVTPPAHYSGSTLAQLDLRKQARVLVIGVRKARGNGFILLPGPDYTIQADDLLMIIGKREGVEMLDRIRKR